jgi:predicted RNA binding protein YcfA (HicA-like mRNA interferase family)
VTRLPSLKPAEIIRKLRKAGFVFDRQAKGSHEIWLNPRTGKRTTVPNHPGKDVSRGTLAAILEHAGIPLEEFMNL